MSCTLTEYRKPHPRYGLADVGWYPKTGWELVDGVWQKLWRNRYVMSRQVHGLRRARVWRKDGAWTWNVSERDARGNWREIAKENVSREGMPYAVAQEAWPFADLAARTGTPVRRSAQRRSA